MEDLPLQLKEETSTMPLAERVFITLEESILKGDIPPGEILTELKLSSMFNVSRTPIREALKRLEQEGLIGIQNSKRVLVLDINLKDLEDIFEMRSALCDLVYKKAVANAAKENLQNLKEILDLQEFYVTHNNIDGQYNCDSNLHLAIYDMIDNTVAKSTLWNLHRKIQRYRHFSIKDPNRAVQALEEHRAIYNAIATGDAEGAAKAARYHAEMAQQNIAKHIANYGVN